MKSSSFGNGTPSAINAMASLIHGRCLAFAPSTNSAENLDLTVNIGTPLHREV